MDSYGRKIDYLRISVTDRCNERCIYCMPAGYKGWAKKGDQLDAAQIVAIAKAAAGVGFRKFRLTGGEPTIRQDLVEIAAGIAALEGAERVALSTNGTRLKRLAADLQSAGVSSVNISLDALSPAVYRQITGFDVRDVLEGIGAAEAAGLRQIKLNCVLMRGVNDEEIVPLVRFAASRGMPIRFIELMPISTRQVLDNLLTVEDAMEILRGEGELVATEGLKLGDGPARYFRFGQDKALVGFIGAMTTPDFCETCNKVRLTSDGKLRPCLGRQMEVDLMPRLREAESDVTDLILQTIANKPKDHEFSGCYEPGRPMTAIGG